MARIEKLGSGSAQESSAPDALRDAAWREMLSGGVWALLSVLVVAYGFKPPGRDVFFLIAAPPFLYGAVRFFHGLMRWMRN